MKPTDSGGHNAYRQHVICLLRQYYPDAAKRLSTKDWKTLFAFLNLDLSPVDTLMADRYSVFGPAPRQPSCMLRSMLLAIIYKSTSFTDWSSTLKTDSFKAIISGFWPGDTPGVGTFYDFCTRLWISDSKNILPFIHPATKKKIQKPKNPDDKAEPVEDMTVYELIQKLEKEPATSDQPYSRLFRIFHDIFLMHSEELGLINLSSLVLSGDGTEVETAARKRYFPVDSVNYKYTQPDTDCGYDSSRHKFYYGYDLYMFTAADSRNDLPIFPLLNRASMHDSFGLCYTYAAMRAFMKDINVTEVLLDSAHDAMAIYLYCIGHGISPIIDLNMRNAVSFEYKDNVTVGKDGVPMCEAGLKMIRDGTEKDRMRTKWRCPNVYHPDGIHCDHHCTDSPYGRVFHTYTKDNPRMFPPIPRDSKKWAKEYNKRTSSERCNKREKIDYKLEDGSHRSSKMWYCRLYCIMMVQHLDAWQPKDSVSQMKELFSSAA